MHFRRTGSQPRAAGGTAALARLEQVPGGEEEEDPPEQRSALYRRALDLIRADFEGQTWEMFAQAVLEGRAPADVAARFGVTANAVRKAKSRVLQRLRAEIGDLID
jgi:RNA polymerase sigma-70 factor (ECF subfamily)